MKLFCVLILILLLGSCRYSAEEKELPGRYVLHDESIGNTQDTLEVRPDKTYRLWNGGEKADADSGKWQLLYSGRVVGFENWPDPYRDLAKYMAGYTPVWNSRIRFNGDEIHLMVADDVNRFYKKID